MMEFERETKEGETESSVQSPSRDRPDVVDVGIGSLTPVMTARRPLTPSEGGKGGPAEEGTGNVEQALDMDFDFNEWFWTEDLNFDFIQWLWTDDFSNDSIYEEAIEGRSTLTMTA